MLYTCKWVLIALLLGLLGISGTSLLVLVLVGSPDNEGSLITDNSAHLGHCLLLISLAHDDEAEATGSTIEAAHHVGLGDIVGSEDVVKVLVNHGEGQVANEEGGLAGFLALVRAGRAAGAGLALSTGGLLLGSSIIGVAGTAAAATGLPIDSRLVLTGDTRASHLNLDLAGVQLGTVQALHGLQGIGLLIEGDEAVAQGTGTTEDDFALSTRNNRLATA